MVNMIATAGVQRENGEIVGGHTNSRFRSKKEAMKELQRDHISTRTGDSPQQDTRTVCLPSFRFEEGLSPGAPTPNRSPYDSLQLSRGGGI